MKWHFRQLKKTQITTQWKLGVGDNGGSLVRQLTARTTHWKLGVDENGGSLEREVTDRTTHWKLGR